jgi:CBS domain-containing protein
VQVDPADPTEALARLGPVASVMIWLGPVNIVLGLFNLVPGFPLDGGRVLRAIFWGIGRDHARATVLAATGGQAFAWLLISCGVAMILGLEVPLFGTGTVPGLWIALIGWFLNNAALASRRKVQVDETLGDLPVGRIMRRDPVSVGPDLTVADLIDGYMLQRSERAFPVLDHDRLLGLICLDDVRTLQPGRRAGTRVAEIMTPVADLVDLSTADPVSLALTRLAERQVNQLPVVQNNRLIGLLTREAILRWLALCEGAVPDSSCSAGEGEPRAGAAASHSDRMDAGRDAAAN